MIRISAQFIPSNSALAAKTSPQGYRMRVVTIQKLVPNPGNITDGPE